ncbi:MAG: PaaI family thioesterase [Alcanivoracaceae bacterium]|nr:PaaI family thioesterase [Alcanivoracaceae bacterium]
MNKQLSTDPVDAVSGSGPEAETRLSPVSFDDSPYSRFLGIEQEAVDGKLVYRMTFRDQHIGNPLIRTFHGGIIASFAEVVAARHLQASGVLHDPSACTSMTFDYLRPAFAGSLSAEPEVVRAGRRFVVVEVNVFLEKSLVSRGRFIYRRPSTGNCSSPS